MNPSNKFNYNDMYLFINEGETIYDFIKAHTGDDLSSPFKMFNLFRKTYNLIQNQINTHQGQMIFDCMVYNYNNYFKKIFTSMNENLTEQEKKFLLLNLQSVNPEKYKFSSIPEYINFLNNSNFTNKSVILNSDKTLTLNADIDKLNQILIKAAFSKCDPEIIESSLTSFLMCTALDKIKEDYLQNNYDPDNVKNSTLKKIDFFKEICSNKKQKQEYDYAINYIKNQKKDEKLKSLCKFKRLREFSNLTGISVPKLINTIDNKDQSLVEMITWLPKLEKSRYTTTLNQYKQYKTNLNFLPKPEIIMNDDIIYSENGIENQKIQVTSYGDFSYTENETKYCNKFKLIGVEIFGNDSEQNKEYIFITPASNVKKIKSQKNAEQYKKILFSPFIMDEISKDKIPFLPEMIINNDKELTENNEKILNFFHYDDEFWNYWLPYISHMKYDGKKLYIKDINLPINNPITILKNSETFKKRTKLLKQKNNKEKDEEER